MIQFILFLFIFVLGVQGIRNVNRFVKLIKDGAVTIKKKELFDSVKEMEIGENYRQAVFDFRFNKIQGINFFIYLYDDHAEITYASFFYDEFVYDLEDKGEKMIEYAKNKIEENLKANKKINIESKINSGEYVIELRGEWYGKYNYI